MTFSHHGWYEAGFITGVPGRLGSVCAQLWEGTQRAAGWLEGFWGAFWRVPVTTWNLSFLHFGFEHLGSVFQDFQYPPIIGPIEHGETSVFLTLDIHFMLLTFHGLGIECSGMTTNSETFHPSSRICQCSNCDFRWAERKRKPWILTEVIGLDDHWFDDLNMAQEVSTPKMMIGILNFLNMTGSTQRATLILSQPRCGQSQNQEAKSEKKHSNISFCSSFFRFKEEPSQFR